MGRARANVFIHFVKKALKVLVTGAAGFIGRNLQEFLEGKGVEVVAVVRSKSQSAGNSYVLNLPNKDIYEIIEKEKPDAVIHAAGTASVGFSVEQPFLDFNVSVPGTAIILDAIRSHSPKSHFVFLSSAAVYGNQGALLTERSPVQPISPYGYHKWMGELLCREYSNLYDVNTTIVRIFSGYGPGLKKQVIYDLSRKAKKANDKGQSLEVIGTGNETRDFIHIADVCQAISLILERKPKDPVFNLASGKEVTISAVADLVLGLCPNISTVRYTNNTRKGDPLNWRADISMLKDLGFSPTVSLADGVKEVFESV